MDSFPLPVFNIESEDEDEHHEVIEVQSEIKNLKCDHVHKLLSDRSLSLPRHNPNAIVKKLETIAENNLLRKDLKETCCSLPGNPRSTFLMVFSPDGSKVASSHGDHKINVTDLRTNKCISTLTGHPRTPWCIAFHPHRNDILASGCLGGQVRVWDLHGGSEMWSVTASEVTTVIASLAFHPSERLLVIATNSTLYFWDWNIPQPFAKCSTANEKQKLRYVSFDPLGNWLLTGISNTPGALTCFSAGTTTSMASSGPSTLGPAHPVSTGIPINYRIERNEQERERNLQSRYQILLDQYERLRIRYQELRYRAAELELNASSNHNPAAFREASVEPSTSRTSPTVESSILNASSSDRFWRTLMNAAENLRALSNIGRSLNNPSQSTSSGNGSSSRTSGPSLDQDARMRIQLLSRHIENMQLICRSHLEMTRHRRQVYRLQQIRRILEDLREQIRYLQVCVRDSLDLVSRMRTTPTSPPIRETSGGSIRSHNRNTTSVERASQSIAANRAGLDIDLQFSATRRMVLGSRAYSPIQCRRFANYLAGRLRPIGLAHNPEHPRWRRNFVAGRESRFSFHHTRSSSPPTNPLEQIDPQLATSREHSMGLEFESENEPSLELRFPHGPSTSWRRSRSIFCRMARTSPTPTQRNPLLHVRNLGIRRRKPSVLSRIFHGRNLQNQMRTATNDPPPEVSDTVATAIPSGSQETSQRSGDQSLRPLMERLESHFRLQRQTMGILAQLNEAAVVSGSGNDANSGSGGPSATSNSIDGSAATSFSDGGSSNRPWATNVLHSIRHWRARRDAFERARSLVSGTTSGNSDRFQSPRRIDSSFNVGALPRYRSFRTIEDDDSSDTDTDLTIDSTAAANRWRQSSPIRSPRGVEQRMRLLWREYLSQVVHVQNNVGESSSAAPQAGTESDSNADQERTRYRLWLSTMVESLTSFFSQHGINSSDTDPPSTTSASTVPPTPGTPPPPPRPGQSIPTFNYVSRVPHAMRDASYVAAAEDGPASPTVVRGAENQPWRAFPRVGIVMGGVGGASTGFSAGGATAGGAAGIETFGGPGQQRWNLRRNAESQVSLSAHLTYRIQAWDFCVKDGVIPDIRDPHANIVVPESKIHNDASVDISADGRFLVTLVPCTSLTGALISLHSLEPSRLGLCLAQVNVDQFVVSVSISPTCRHLLLGLASSRALSVASRDHSLPTLWAQVYQIPIKVFQARRNSATSSTSGSDTADQSRLEKKCIPQGMLLHVRDLSQTTDVGLTSLNCIRWIPTAGQGFVLGTNKGHLKVID